MTWKFWTRNSPDPLVREFIDKYQIHLLSFPRENVYIGDLYVYDSKKIQTPGNIKHFLLDKLVIPSPKRNETMVNIRGIISSGIDIDAGLDFFESFIVALSGQEALDMSAEYKLKGTKKIKFRFLDLTRDSIDVLEFGKLISKKTFDKSHPMYRKDNRYFVVTAIIYSKSISILAESENQHTIDIDIRHIVKNHTKLSLYRSGNGEITYANPKRLPFGVEVYELEINTKEDSLNILSFNEPMRFRGPLKPSIIGDPINGSIFIDFV